MQSVFDRLTVARGFSATTVFFFNNPDVAAARRWSEDYVSERMAADYPFRFARAELSASDGLTIWEWETPDA
jgi:hypothetical protein